MDGMGGQEEEQRWEYKAMLTAVRKVGSTRAKKEKFSWNHVFVVLKDQISHRSPRSKRRPLLEGEGEGL